MYGKSLKKGRKVLRTREHIFFNHNGFVLKQMLFLLEHFNLISHLFIWGLYFVHLTQNKNARITSVSA